MPSRAEQYEQRRVELAALFPAIDDRVRNAIVPALYENEIQMSLAGLSPLHERFPLLRSVTVPLHVPLVGYSPLVVDEVDERPGFQSYVLRAAEPVRWTAAMVEWSAL